MRMHTVGGPHDVAILEYNVLRITPEDCVLGTPALGVVGIA